MTKGFAATAVALFLVAAPASANHLFNLGDPYPTRGACEARLAELDNVDRDSLRQRFPDLFTTKGDARAFIAGAFKCERDDEDGQWYITDHLQERLDSDWFLRRQD